MSIPDREIIRTHNADGTEWEPGDHLYRRGASYQGFLYNFREIETNEECHCADRASWPTPAFHELPSEEWFIDYFKAQLGIENG